MSYIVGAKYIILMNQRVGDLAQVVTPPLLEKPCLAQMCVAEFLQC